MQTKELTDLFASLDQEKHVGFLLWDLNQNTYLVTHIEDVIEGSKNTVVVGVKSAHDYEE